MTKNLEEDLDDEDIKDTPDEDEGGEEIKEQEEEKSPEEEVDAGENDDREEIRERRRRERKARKERDRRERVLAQQREAALIQEIKETKAKLSAFEERMNARDTSSIDSEMAECDRLYTSALEAIKQGVAEGDGDKVVRAQNVKDRAFARYHQLVQQKNGFKTETKPEPKQETEKQRVVSSDHDEVDPRIVRFATQWKRNNSWFDASTTDGKIADVIGADLLNEGYEASEKEYWDELNDRLRERLPHRFKRSGSPPIGESGRGSVASQEQQLPREFVETLKQAGYWDDPAKRKAAIKNYRETQSAKGAR